MRLLFRHPEPGLSVTLQSDGAYSYYGTLSASGLGVGTGYPLGIIGGDGLLTRLDGTAYTLPVAGLDDPEPPQHRLTVWRDARPVRTVLFTPQGPGPELDVLGVAVDDIWN